MAYTISGRYVGSCSCLQVCPCPYDGPPKDPTGRMECRGTTVFHVDRGNLDAVDLSGVNFAVFNFNPSNFSSGNFKLGVVIDESVSDEQAKAIEAILSGQAGGPFADMAPLIGELVGIERAKITYSDGGAPKASVAGMAELAFQPYVTPEGSRTTVRNAPFGFAPEFEIGTASGKTDSFGGLITYEASYGESAAFTYSSEAHDIRPRA